MQILYGCLKMGLFLDIIGQDTYLVTQSIFLPSCNNMGRIRIRYFKELFTFHIFTNYIALKVIVHLIHTLSVYKMSPKKGYKLFMCTSI